MSVLTNAIATSTTPAAAITPALHNIDLNYLGVPSTITVGQQTTPAEKTSVSSPFVKLQSLEAARFSWETTELAASNKRLYSILKNAYAYYLAMKLDSIKETRAQYANDLAKFIEERGYVFTPSSHDMTRVVKCVFGTDRRRVSAYSIALREALRQNVSAEDLIAFIEQEGGVEQIRMGGTKPLSISKRAAKVKSEIINTHLGMIKFDPMLFAADSDWIDQQVIIVATYQPSGEFQANAVVKHDSAVNAALAAHYSKQQAAARAIEKAEKEANAEVEKLVKENEKAMKKAAKVENQKAAMATEKASDAIAASKTASFNALFKEIAA